MPIPTQIRYGTVVGQFVSSSVDGSDVDGIPDIIPLKGSIVFSAAPSYVLDYGTSPNPVTITTSQITCPLDSEGYLCSPPTTPGGPLTRGVQLIATDNASISPTMWTWTVNFVLRNQQGRQVQIPIQYINVPSGAVVDLTTISNIAASNGTVITKGLKGDKGDQGDSIVGPQGPTGEIGPIGPQGIQGNAGTVDVGTTTTGNPGAAASVVSSGTPTARILDFVIPRGEVGPVGPTGATGATGPQGIQGVKGDAGDPTLYELRGTGMPNLVVTASPGTYYTDTAGTNGAWRWLKKTGTGNTGWVVVSGDTGWRDVSSLFQSICTANSLTYSAVAGFLPPAIRRINDTIFYRVGVNITGATIGTVDFRSALQPTGFRTDQISNWQIPASVTGSAGVIHFSPGNYIRFWTAGAQYFEKTFSASEAWPTTLPGTAA